MQNVEPISQSLHFAVSLLVGACFGFVVWVLCLLVFFQFPNGYFGAWEDVAGFLYMGGMLLVFFGGVAGGVYSFRSRRG